MNITEATQKRGLGGGDDTSKPPTRSPSVSSVASSTTTTHQSTPAATPRGFGSPVSTAATIPLAAAKPPGTKGRVVKIDTNYLKLHIEKLVTTAYHYDVSIEPNMPKRFMPFVFEEFRKKNFAKIFIAFDGQKNAISPQLLKLDSANIERQVTIEDPDNAKPRVYTVAIKELKGHGTGAIDMKSLSTYQQSRQFDLPARAMQAMEIILKSVFLAVKGVQCGRSFYTAPVQPYSLGDNYELWTGLFQSTILGARPYLNVDIAHKAFPSPMNVIEIIKSFRNGDTSRALDNRTAEELRTHLKGLRITYATPGQAASTKCYKFMDLALPPGQVIFLFISLAFFFPKHNFHIYLWIFVFFFYFFRSNFAMKPVSR